MLFDRTAPPAPELNRRQRWVVVALDVAVLAELTVSMYAASAHPDSYAGFFMKLFFTMLLPTLLVALGAIRRFRHKDGETKEQAPA